MKAYYPILNLLDQNEIYLQAKKIVNGSNRQKLILPHPKMHNRNFVILHLFEITKSWIHPLKKISISKLLNSLEVEDLRTIKLI